MTGKVFSMQKALTGVALGLGLSVAGAAYAVPFSYGFEDGLTGDWTPPITNVLSGGGVLGVASAAGTHHAELTNIPGSDPDGACCGFGNFSTYGHVALAPSPAVGRFFQSLAVYIDVGLNSAASGLPGFWIDMAPRNNAAPFGSDTRAEQNFRITTNGSSAAVDLNGGAVVATLTTSGWYNFEFTFEEGAGGVVVSDAFVKALDGTVLGSALDVESPNPGTMPVSELGSEGYVWITHWLNGYGGPATGPGVLAIDCQASGLGDGPIPCGAAVPEPGILALLGLGLFGLGFARRKLL
jgi:hypothetical protein